MEMTYPLKFRIHVQEVQKKEGLNDVETAERFCVSLSSIKRWHKKQAPKEKRERSCKIDMEALAEDVKERPDDYQHERAQRFGMSQRGMCSALKRLGLTRKKSHVAS